MKHVILAFLITTALSFNLKAQNTCRCNVQDAEKIINNKDFNKISKFDNNHISFYKLSSEDNRILWFRDIANPYQTSFTKLWNDYAPNNYHSSQLDFCNAIENNKRIILGFQFGPNVDLWAYHIFIVQKINCCYLITRSYFRHARFTYKAYSIIDQDKFDSLSVVIKSLNKRPIIESSNYCGYFVDNQNSQKFYVDFDRDTVNVLDVTSNTYIKRNEYDSPVMYRTEHTKEIKDLFNFVDKSILWKETYK